MPPPSSGATAGTGRKQGWSGGQSLAVFEAVTSRLSPSLSEGDGRTGGAVSLTHTALLRRFPAALLSAALLVHGCRKGLRDNCTYTPHSHTDVGTDVSRDSKWSGGRFFHPGEWGGG